jgi:hypothetical protein
MSVLIVGGQINDECHWVNNCCNIWPVVVHIVQYRTETVITQLIMHTFFIFGESSVVKGLWTFDRTVFISHMYISKYIKLSINQTSYYKILLHFVLSPWCCVFQWYVLASCTKMIIHVICVCLLYHDDNTCDMCCLSYQDDNTCLLIDQLYLVSGVCLFLMDVKAIFAQKMSVDNIKTRMRGQHS